MIERSPEWATPYYNLGKLLLDSGKTDEAIQILGQGFAEIPGNESLLYVMAFAHQRAGDHDAAIAIYERLWKATQS